MGQIKEDGGCALWDQEKGWHRNHKTLNNFAFLHLCEIIILLSNHDCMAGGRHRGHEYKCCSPRQCYWPNIQILNNKSKPAKLVNRTTGTSGKYANEILSHLFEPFFRKLDTESSDCNSGKDVSKVYFFKDRPTLSMLHLTPSKVKMSRNCHSSSECILAFIMTFYDHANLFHTDAIF